MRIAVTSGGHQIIGGSAHRIKTLGIPGEFGQSAYIAEHLYEHHGLTAAKLVESAEALMKS